MRNANSGLKVIGVVVIVFLGFIIFSMVFEMVFGFRPVSILTGG